MKNLYKLTKLSDNDFLSFLYSERDREVSKSGAPGWSLWALVGTAFALTLFIYTTLKTIDSINFLLCYYIFTVFCPIALYIIFIVEHVRMMKFGDCIHVERLKNIAPITLLSCLTGIYGSMIMLGVLLRAATESIVCCVAVLVPLVASYITIAMERNKLVTTFAVFRVSSLVWLNRILVCVVGGTLLLPLFGGLRHLTFGFSEEFEITIAIVGLMAIVYIVIQNKMNRNRVTDIDELIDGFLYRDWTRQSIVRKLELSRLGKSPFIQLEKEYNKVVDASGLIKDAKKRTREITAKIEEQGLKDDELDDLLNEIKEMTSTMASVLNSQAEFHEKSEELINLKSTLGDSEFCAMLETAYDLNFVNQVFDDCHSLMNLVDKNIVPKINEYIKKVKEEIAYCDKCSFRIENHTTKCPEASV